MNWRFWKIEGVTGAATKIGRGAAAAVVAYLLVCAVLGWWWDYEPDAFDVNENAVAHAAAHGVTPVTGYTTTATLLRLAETLLDKRGGYLSNDLFPPGVWLDNVPNWEFGVLVQIRDMARELRLDFSRSQSQSAEDPDLSEAEGQFYWDNASWIFPDTEGEYRKGIGYLERYMGRLADPNHPDAPVLRAGRQPAQLAHGCVDAAGQPVPAPQLGRWQASTPHRTRGRQRCHAIDSDSARIAG